VQGQIPANYLAPLSGAPQLVGTFRVEDPNALARIAFIEALERHGVDITAATVAANPAGLLPATSNYPAGTELARYVSAPWSQHARLVLKVSLNLGANLALSLFGLENGVRTVDQALAVERETLISDFGIDGSLFSFPTNGSGTPDSQAAPQALVRLLVEMAKSPVAVPYEDCLPVLGVDGSLAPYGTNLPGRGRVYAKPGTSILPDDQGQLQLKALCLAGYIDTLSGRKVAYALMVNDAGPVSDIETDVGAVFSDQAEISSLIYESL
jgi:D-alanyl-D-alanine carboxypeptidase/D-alanyl-D-alanine-endopeptidase (penicillin-binding protein 4)